MNDDFLTGDVHLAIYGPDRFSKATPFAENGYLFTVPGTFPEDTPAHTNVVNQEMAVYRTKDDPDEWEVRDVDGDRRVWSTAGSRREAIGLAFLEIARRRRIDAARVAEKRKAAGLEPIPPYRVEIIDSVTLVLAPTKTAVLERVQPAEGETSACYRVRDVGGGEPYEIRTDEAVWHTVTTGILHERCGHDPDDARRFENEPEALIYAKHGLTRFWVCTELPSAADELFTVDGSHYGPYPARPAPDTWNAYEPISVTREVAERIAHDLNTLNAGCGLSAEWNGADLVFTWDQRYRHDNGTEAVTPGTDGRYLIGGLWPWMRWADRD
ncbi:hypothetical protein ABZ923_34565 [Streptomyces sp. NPDC046881]|uniref:hypothetical protein n=1 Tax=Streptomyces sp. NPDC046881 TaxID=3155374 RepID=UPI0033CAFFC9